MQSAFGWTEAGERAARNRVWAIRLRSRVLQQRTQAEIFRARGLSATARLTLVRTRVLLRRSRWLVEVGRPLPRLVARTGGE